MAFTTKKQFDISGTKKEIFEASHKLACECHQTGNGGSYSFKIVENPTGEIEGFSYLSNKEVKALTDWLISEGAIIGDEVLICHWW